MPSESVRNIIESVTRVITRSEPESESSPAKRKSEFEQSIENIEPKNNCSVYVHDSTYGWVLVRSGFTEQEAKYFAQLITDFDEFNSHVSCIDVIVTSQQPSDEVAKYDDVFTQLPASVKSGVKYALEKYMD